jgi:hypothetical protein
MAETSIKSSAKPCLARSRRMQYGGLPRQVFSLREKTVSLGKLHKRSGKTQKQSILFKFYHHYEPEKFYQYYFDYTHPCRYCDRRIFPLFQKI